MTRKIGPRGEGSVYYRADKDLWVAAVTLPSGRRKRVYGKTEAAARKERRRILAEVEAGKPVPLGRTPTIGRYLTHWLDVRIGGEVAAGHIEPSTADHYGQMVTGHILPTPLADVRIDRAGADDVRAWQRDRLATPSKRTKKGAEPKSLSARTVGMAHAVLRRALGDAVRDELISRNVAALVKLPAGQTKGAVKPTEVEIAAVMAEMLADEHAVLWLTMLALGNRKGEALGMRWSLTDLDAGTTKLRRQIVRQRGPADPATGRRKGSLVEKDLKTEASKATLQMPPVLVEIWRDWRRRQVKERLAATFWADPDLVFTTSVGTAMDPRNVNRLWAAVCKRAGVRSLRVHDLRHAAASLAHAAGATVKEIQAQLRHTRLGTTADIYVDVFEEVKRGTADRMDGVIRRMGWRADPPVSATPSATP